MNAVADDSCSDFDQLSDFDSFAHRLGGAGVGAHCGNERRRCAIADRRSPRCERHAEREPLVGGRIGSSATIASPALLDLICIKGRFWNNR